MDRRSLKKGSKVRFWIGDTEAEAIIRAVRADRANPPHGVFIDVLTATPVKPFAQCYWPDGAGGRIAVVAEDVALYRGRYLVTIGAFLP